MFENLTQRLESAFRKLRSKGVLTDKDVQEGLREVRLALLEADVHYGLAKEVVKRVGERAVGQEVLSSLSPTEQVIRALRDELVEALGGHDDGDPAELQLPDGKAAVLMVGLQGAGKTTTCAKLALRWSKQGRRPLLVSTDVQRPAAREQLAVLAEQVGVEGYRSDAEDPTAICEDAWRRARELNCDVLIVDSAGRLHVDDSLMEDLRSQKGELRPDEILLVADAMTGQDALASASAFHEAMGLTGVVLTKLDGDAKGGAVLSLRHATGVPVRYVGTGEKPGDIEPFHANRMVSRILGRGDVLTLIEKAEESLDQERTRDIAKKVMGGDLDLQDMLDQMRMVRRLGPLGKVFEMLGGPMKGMADQVDERQMRWIEAIILSMTPKERRHPKIIDHSRKRRIAQGSGRPLSEVNRLLKQHKNVKKQMKRLKKLTRGKGKGALPKGIFPGMD